eukprot:4977230-Pyramimonas_sp.AAC.1
MPEDIRPDLRHASDEEARAAHWEAPGVLLHVAGHRHVKERKVAPIGSQLLDRKQQQKRRQGGAVGRQKGEAPVEVVEHGNVLKVLVGAPCVRQEDVN